MRWLRCGFIWILVSGLLGIVGCRETTVASRSPGDAGSIDRDGGHANVGDATAERGDAGSGYEPPFSEPTELDAYLGSFEGGECAFETPFTFDHAVDTFRVRTVCSSGCDYETVAAAVAAAEPFDDILIEPGIHSGCLRIDVSPLRIRGDGGLVSLRSDCDEGPILELDGSHFIVENLRIVGDADAAPPRGVGVRVLNARQVSLSRLWIQHVATAVKAAESPDGSVWIDRTKVRDAGHYNYRTSHSQTILDLPMPRGVWISRSVFSHFRERAWLLSGHGLERLELVCNTVYKPTGDAGGHSFHLFRPVRLRFHHNLFHESTGRLVLYTYRAPEESSMVLSDNTVLFDSGDSDAKFGGGVSRREVHGNVFIGASGDAEGNVYFADRESAGLEPFPAVPPDWPVQRF